MTKTRGFEPVEDKHIKNKSARITEAHTKKHEFVNKLGKREKFFLADTQLPVRADARSAGYDFFSPIDITILPAQKTLLFTDVKAYMQNDEVLMLYPRSSMGIKKGLMLSNTVGVIDSSYYSNEDNDGNIGLPLLNTSGRAIEIKRGERIAQGVFVKYLVADEDNVLYDERIGGIGSSDRE